MPITITETPRSREQDIDKFGSTGMREYFCVDDTFPNDQAEVDVYNAVQEEAPDPEPAFGLERRKITLRPLGGPCWLASVQYVVPEAYQPYDPLGPEFSAEVTAGTVHVTQSRSTRSQTVNASLDNFTAPNTSRAINVSNRGVGGCDVFSSACDITFTLRRKTMSIAYVQTLKKVCCTMNLLNFLGYKPGELLFVGASVCYRGSAGWVVVYRFHTAENQPTVEIVPAVNAGAVNGLVIEGTDDDPAKRGWDYLWVGYVEQTAGAGTLQTPAFANVEVVFGESDFATELGWGGPDPLDPPPALPGPGIDPYPDPDDAWGDQPIDPLDADFYQIGGGKQGFEPE